MTAKTVFLKASFVLMTFLAALHTFFIIIGGPPLPTTPEFLEMQESMRSILIDSGGGIMHSTQDFMDGFNIIVSIFLITLPLLGWTMLKEIKDNRRAVQKMTLVMIVSVAAFFLTSLTLLAIGGTVISGITSVLLLASLFVNRKHSTTS